MTVRVVTPLEVVLEREAGRVSARGSHGAFTLLPRHVDCVAALLPGLVSLDGEVLAVDEGILVKQGEQVTMSVRDAVLGAPLETLLQAVEQRFLALDERERRARSALALLEGGLLRRFLEMR